MPRRRDPSNDAALPDAVGERALHQCHARQETGRHRRAEESRRHLAVATSQGSTMVGTAGVGTPCD